MKKNLFNSFFHSKGFKSPVAICLLLIANCLLTQTLSAQNDSAAVAAVPAKHKIAIFAPLYLDSAFNSADEYRYAKNIFPKFINPGLEFFEGAQLALDSMAKEQKELEIFVYDTRSSKESLEQLLSRPEIDEMSLIIANCAGNEVWQFAEAGLKKQIPVINATVPSDAGATANPYFVLLNPTLKTQCEAIYRYVQKYYSINPIVFFRKKGATEDAIKTFFDDFSKITMAVPLKIKYVELPDSFTVNQLKAHLNETRNTLCIAGTLDINFGKRMALQLASLSKQYPSTVMGMPTWEAIKDFNKPEFKGPEIIYGTPFYYARTDKTSQGITNYFNTTMYARPSEMVFRGYEVVWKFANLLLKYGKDLSSNLSNKQNNILTDFDIQPVLNRSTMSLEYYENKKVSFLKWQDGFIKTVN